jgi:hypothetical protein
MRSAIPLLLLSACAGLGCSSTRNITFSSEPSGALVQVDGRNVGTTPVQHALDFRSSPRIVVGAQLAGFYPEEVTLSKRSKEVKEGHLQLVLQEDAAWKATTTSEATNNWMRVQVDPSIAPADVWQKLIDSVTSRYSNLEQLDDGSGYVRTVSEVRRFQGAAGFFQVRTRFLGSMSSRTPLVYKFRIEAEKTDVFGDWVPYERVFKEDAQLVQELQDRLGIK